MKREDQNGSYDVRSQSKSRLEAIAMIAPFSCILCQRNHAAIFKAQIMAVNTESNRQFVISQYFQLGEEDLQKSKKRRGCK